ncbi:MAG: DUF342 domain-containing protein [Alteromonadaceae bacterium]|nr:DUF342 domain-containing protein [Alteromonadaceae bacterium]
MTKAKLVPNKKNNIDLVLEPEKDGSNFTNTNVNELIEKSEYASFYVNTANIKNSIAELNSVLKHLQENQIGREIRYQVLERRDASITITIDNDEMAATAEISTAFGGKHLSAKAILNSAQTSGVSRGFSKEELIKLAHQAAKEPSGSLVKARIAKGKLAIDGKDSQIKHLVQSAQERILKPKTREDGSVDMRDLGDIICVKIGDPLVQKVPLTPGKKGYTVTGNPLEPSPGGDLEITTGEGTEISQKNENILVSTKVGLPKIIENGMEIDEVYKIKTVDVSTGHIDFQGSVIIDGDVCEGMKVIASGDITVGGFVESALVSAGGDITISKGIIGRKQDIDDSKIDDINMSVEIIAKGKVYAKYCQYAELTSGCDVRIEKQLMHSILSVDGKLWVGNENKANGKLIAGYINAGKSVHAGIVGATAGGKTIITFEKQINTYNEQLQDIESRYRSASDKTTELEKAGAKLRKLPKNKAQPEMLAKVTATYQFHAKSLGKTLTEKEETEQKLQEYMTSVFVEVTEKLYQGVELRVSGFHQKSKREYGPSRMIYKNRKINIEPIVNN